MKEHPILFSAPMVRAILDGRKTQTRRVVKPQPNQIAHGWEWPGTRAKAKRASGAIATMGADPFAALLETLAFSCPYGRVGDRLWVRETFCECENYAMSAHDPCDGERYTEIIYRADDTEQRPLKDVHGGYNWKPSIFMPRAASRITLEITDVRAERLLQISPSDALSEGVEKWPDGNFKSYDRYKGKYTHARDSYLSLWDAINGEKSHAQDPFVWVITFIRLQRTGG